jgi:hypothetical protein
MKFTEVSQILGERPTSFLFNRMGWRSIGEEPEVQQVSLNQKVFLFLNTEQNVHGKFLGKDKQLCVCVCVCACVCVYILTHIHIYQGLKIKIRVLIESWPLFYRVTLRCYAN